jgi:site-specific DNA recombinase
MAKKTKKTDGPLRAALYMRVSSGAQAKRDLSIPDQRRQLRDYCTAQGWSVVEEFKDARTGTNAKRPEFQRMMDSTHYGEVPFDVIVVHSFSRFFRDEIESELRIRSLAKRGVRLVSITQEFEDSPLGEMVRRIMALFDEYDSKETSKHVSRALAENARQGYFNGGTVPFGFKAVEVEKRGSTSKKKLVPREDEAEVVRLMFQLYLKGDGSSGPMGVKRVTEWLNDHGYRTRKRSKWGIGPVHRSLTDTIHKGEYWRNRDSEISEPILIPVPPIISADDFDQVRRTLESRNPKKVPPRTVSSPVLLGGLATCASCGSGMIISTGKSGKYRYYACGGRVRQGKGTCEGRRIRMQEIDDLVLTAIMEDLLTQERMTEFLQELQERQTAKTAAVCDSLAKHEAQLSDVKAKLSRLLELVETGIIETSDPSLAERLDNLRTQRDITDKAVKTARKKLVPEERITEKMVSQFNKLMQHALTQDAPPFRRAYLRSVVDKVEIDKTEVRIHARDNQGSNSTFRARNGTRRSAETRPRRVSLRATQKTGGKHRTTA